MTQRAYDHFEHRHRFAVWAAARATQRSFTSVINLREALESSSLCQFLHLSLNEDISPHVFDALHRQWCKSIMEYLKDVGVQNVMYGRAAKLVAVYLKAMIVVGPDCNSPLASVAHPPIDAILLRNLSASEGLPEEVRELFRTTRWTKLDEEHYYALVGTIRNSFPDTAPFWMLEQYWTVTDEPEEQ